MVKSNVKCLDCENAFTQSPLTVFPDGRIKSRGYKVTCPSCKSEKVIAHSEIEENEGIPQLGKFSMLSLQDRQNFLKARSKKDNQRKSFLEEKKHKEDTNWY